MVWIERPAIERPVIERPYSTLKWFKGRTSIYNNQNEKNIECVRVKSVRSYEQAGEVSHKELQKGHEDLYRKEPSGLCL